jgi:A118 family predicted phage portal protein
MPNVSVKNRLKNVNQLYDITHYYRQLGKCIYQGYVSKSFGSDVGIGYKDEFEPYSYYSYYKHKGSLLRRKDMKLANAIGRYIINNQYAEYPDIAIENSEKDTNNLLKILEDNEFNIKEKDNTETSFHIGDRILKPYVSKNKLIIQYITGDLFFSTRVDNGNVISGIFPTFTIITKGNKIEYYTRVEWHYAAEEENINAKGRVIRIQIYKGDSQGHLKTLCNYATSYSIFGTFVKEREEYHDLEQPTFVLIKNPTQNNKNLHDGRGIGGVINTLDSVMSANEGYNAKSQDIVWGSMKVIAPESSTEETYDIKTNKTQRAYNPNDPMIFPYNDESMGSNKPEAFAPTLRIEQHIESISYDVDVTSINVGINAGSLRFDGKSIITATQRIIEKSDTARTILEYENETTNGWEDLFMLIKYYANNFTGDTFTFEKKDINIQWKDNIAIDDEKTKEDHMNLLREGLIPRYYILVEDYGYTEEEAKRLVAEADTEKMAIFDEVEEEETTEEEVE